ncbi:MAG: metal ABC transporter substrate-binding protein [Acidimicrobiales bacterium]
MLLGALALAGACSSDDDGTPAAGGGTLNVVASFYPLAELATRVGGDAVRVTNLTPVGVEPHDVELTSRQVDQLEDADVVLYLGEDFQPAVAEVAENRDGRSLDLLDHVTLLAEGDEADPHFWLDPRRMAEAVRPVTEALAERSAANAESFEANGAAYAQQLAALDQELERGLADCDRREIVTAHAAFAYLADRYRLEQLAIAGLSPEAEPDAERLAELADQVEAKGITTVFFEELVPDDVADALARETGTATAVLNPIEGLEEDDAEAGKDYAAVMRDNLTALRAALGCR